MIIPTLQKNTITEIIYLTLVLLWQAQSLPLGSTLECVDISIIENTNEGKYLRL